MPDPYELLVKEYLETKGWIVRVDTRFYKKRRGWSDLDILATKRAKGKNRYLVAEVKGTSVTKREIDKINKHLTHPDLKGMLKERFDIENYRKWIYCWYLGKNKKRLKDYAKKFKIEIKTFEDVIDSILKRLKESYFERGKWVYERDYPYTTILQIIMHGIDVGSIKLSDFKREKK